MASSIRYDDSAWQELKARLLNGEYHVRVGYVGPKSNESHDGITMVELGTIHEFGAPGAGIPERAHIRPAFYKNVDKIIKLQARIGKAMLERGMTPLQGMKLIGEFMTSETRKFITEGPHIPPPLKPETIARKGSDRPLVDTGRLVQAISYEIVRGSE
jgi:hypothetical protein